MRTIDPIAKAAKKRKGPRELIAISTPVMSRLRKYCKQRGLIMSKYVSMLLSEHLDRIKQ